MSRPTRTIKDVKQAVKERVKDLPMQAARLTVTGIGRLLLLTDRIRAEAREAGVGEKLVRLRDDAGRLVGKVADRVSGGAPRVPPRPTTGRTAAGTAAGAPAAPGPSAVKPAAEAAEKEAKAPEPAATEPAPKPAREPAESAPASASEAAAAAGAPTAADLPIPDYDSRTIPSLRARLRGLTVEQVSLLRDYERANAARPDVLRMYDNRIAKLTAESGG